MNESDLVSTSSPELPRHEVTRSSSRTGKLVALVAVAALAVPFGLRVRSAIQAEHAVRAQKPAPAAVPSIAVVRGTKTVWKPVIVLNGTLMPSRSVSLAFKATGTMSTLKAKAGDRVESGALLAALDASETYAQSNVVAAQIETAKANLMVARDQEQRTSALARLGVTPESTATQVKGQLSVATASLAGAQASLALQRALLANHTLRAPFPGVITTAPTAAGGLAVAGAPLFVLDDLETLRVVGTIAEHDAPMVRLGARVLVSVGDKVVPAAVTTVVPKVDAATRRMPIEATLKNDGTLLAGVFVHATVDGGDAREVLRFPATVVRPGSQDELVVMEGGAPRVRRVSFVRADDGAVLVRSGVTADEDVLLAPAPETGGTP